MKKFEEGNACPGIYCSGNLEYDQNDDFCKERSFFCDTCVRYVDKLLTLIKQENTMEISENILKVFEASKDAALVAKHFGKDYGDSFKDYLALSRHSDAILKEATRLNNIESATS